MIKLLWQAWGPASEQQYYSIWLPHAELYVNAHRFFHVVTQKKYPASQVWSRTVGMGWTKSQYPSDFIVPLSLAKSVESIKWNTLAQHCLFLNIRKCAERAFLQVFKCSSPVLHSTCLFYQFGLSIPIDGITIRGCTLHLSLFPDMFWMVYSRNFWLGAGYPIAIVPERTS